MNPLAKELNEIIKENNENVLNVLSNLGKELFFPKGILSQTGEAKKKATKYNATIGMAKEENEVMYLNTILNHIQGLVPSEIFPYSPAPGNLELRNIWKDQMIKKNPSLKDKQISLPVVTSALTHGLSICADLFIDNGDILVLPDKLWGNYKLAFAVRRGADIKTFPLFNSDNGFNIDAFDKLLAECHTKTNKVVMILNFPNNPTGYAPTANEQNKIVEVIKKYADKGANLVCICDDAYFGLFYEENVAKESIFGKLAGLSKNILAVKLDGATKEDFAWGFRVGFITYATQIDGNNPEPLYEALQKKTMGIIRGTISNCCTLTQNLVKKAIQSEAYESEKKAKFSTLKNRANKVKDVLASGKYSNELTPYPFNSGYFMCIKINSEKASAEDVRLKLLDEYGIGVISLNEKDLRIAFSCVEEKYIEDLFDSISEAIKSFN